MTDKQIIIDGVDVSGCEFLGVKLAKNRMCACSMIDFCNEEPNCYYKQLKAKEQECEELQTELKNFKEQIKLQNNFIDSLLKATNNSEWLDKSMLDDEASEIIEKIELDYAQLDQLKFDYAELEKRHNDSFEQFKQLKAENDELKNTVDYLRREFKNIKWTNKAISKQCENLNCKDLQKLKQTLTEIKEIMKKHCRKCKKHKFYHFQLCCTCKYTDILQKISEVEDE